MQTLDNTALRESLRGVAASLRDGRVDDSLERLLDIRDEGVTHRQLDARIEQLRDGEPGAVEAVLSWTLSFIEALGSDRYTSPLQWLEEGARRSQNAHATLEEPSRHPTPARGISPDAGHAAQSFDELDAPPSIDFAIISEVSESSDESSEPPPDVVDESAPAPEAEEFFDVDSQWSEIAVDVSEGEARRVEDMMTEEGDLLGDDFSLGEELESLDDFDEIESLEQSSPPSPSTEESTPTSAPQTPGRRQPPPAEKPPEPSASESGGAELDDEVVDAGFQLFDEEELAEIERAASGDASAAESSESDGGPASIEASSEPSEPAMTQRGVFDESDVQIPSSHGDTEQNPSAGTVQTSTKAAPFSARKTPIRGTPIVVDFEDILDDENFDELVRSSMIASGEQSSESSSIPSSSVISEGEDSGPSTDVAPPGTVRDEPLEDEEHAPPSLQSSPVEDEDDDFDFDLGFSNPAGRIETPAGSHDTAEAPPDDLQDPPTSEVGRFGAHSSPESDDTPEPITAGSRVEEDKDDDFDFDLGFTNPAQRQRSQKPTPVPVEKQRSDTPVPSGRSESHTTNETHPGHHQKTPAGGVSASLLEQAGSSDSASKSGAFDPGRDSVSEDEFFALAEDIAREQSESEETSPTGNKSYRGEPIVRGESIESPSQPSGSNPGKNPFAFDAPTGVHDPLAGGHSSSVIEEELPHELESSKHSLDDIASEVLMEARNAFVDRDLHRALTLLDEVLDLDEDHDEASTLRALIVEEIGEDAAEPGGLDDQGSEVLTASGTLSSEAGAPAGEGGSLTDDHLECVPELEVDMSELATLDLDHRSGFLLAQIDGMLTVQDLIDLCSMSFEETLDVLGSLREAGIISLQ